jgi:hypothetical protein
MTTTKDDQPLNREPRPNGATDGRVPADTRTSGTPAASQNDKKPEPEPSQEFDPWKFGVHPVAADLRAEILANGFPASPGRGDFWEEVGKAKPSEPTQSAAPQGPKKAERETDTLRLQRRDRIPVDHPLRAMAPWLVIATIGTMVLLWLLIGHEKPKPGAPQPAADLVTTPKLPTAGATAKHATTPATTTVEQPRATPEPQLPAATSGAPSTSAHQPATREERTERKPVKKGSPPSLGTPKPPGQAPTAPATVPTPGSSRIVPADD